MTEEKYLMKLIRSYEEIMDLQREKIRNLEKELEKFIKNQDQEPIKVSDPKPVIVNKNTIADIPTKEEPIKRVLEKPPFGSMTNRTKLSTLQDYIANGGITELKKTPSIPTPVTPTQKDVKTSNKINKEEKRPRIVKRHIFFRSYNSAQSFVDRYSEDFGLGKVKRTVRGASETHYEIKKNTIENNLYGKGFIYVLVFSMNGLDFGAIEDLEKLEKYHSDSVRCVRLFKEKEKVG